MISFLIIFINPLVILCVPHVDGMNEDGSFIGKYRKDRNPEQSSAFATLV